LWRKQGGQHVAPTLDDVPGARTAKPEPAPAKHSTSDQPTNGNRSGEATIAADASKKRLNPIKRKQMEDRVRELEEAISRTESAIASLETALQNFVNADESQRQSQELDQHKSAHAALIKEWEAMAEALQGSD
jgi:ATP-binding cassette subfamily F protein 3